MDSRDRTARSAATNRRRLRETIFPYWLAVSRDNDHGGYLLGDDFKRSWGRRLARQVLRSRAPRARNEKQLVAHARLVWVFSLAHRKGFGKGDEYLTAAGAGYDFLLEHFLDRAQGGLCWSTDRAGSPVNDAKILYGQAFAISGFVQYARAGGDAEALQHALDLHRAVEQHLHDDEHRGWREHADSDWRPLAPGDPRFGIDVIGRKSGDASIHWMEALGALSAATGDDRVRRSLAEVIDMSRRHLFPPDPERTQAYCFPDWTPDAEIANSWPYGHNVEFAWLKVEAERALGADPSWAQLCAYLDHTLQHGFDHRRGGVYRSDLVEPSVVNTDKVFWVQAEMVAALTEALVQRDEPRYASALARHLTFVERHQVDRADGVWLHSVTERGRRRVPQKSSVWKVGFHEVRALVKLVDAFAPSPSA